MKNFEKYRKEFLQSEDFDFDSDIIDENQIYMFAIDIPLIDIEGVYKPFTILITPGYMPIVLFSDGSDIGMGVYDMKIISLLSSMLANVERILSKCSIAEDIPVFSSESISIYIKTKTKNYHLLCIEEDTKNYVENIIQILFTCLQTYGGIYTCKPSINQYTISIEDIKRINKSN